MNVATGRDHLIGMSIGVIYVAALMTTAGDLALSRDESFYVDASQMTAQWIQLLFDQPLVALTRASVDHFWSYNHEHPGLMKTLAGMMWIAQMKWQVFPRDSLAFRFAGMTCTGLLLWLLYIFGTRLHNRIVGVASVFGFALLPRIFYHAHLHAFDIPIVFFVTLVVYCYWRSLTQKRWALWTALAYGLALDTKHNSWLLPLVLGTHWAWFRTGRSRRAAPLVARMPWALLGMVTLSPVIFVGSWPWLWHDTLRRIANYINFHTHHAAHHGIINVEYFGKNIVHPPFPVSVPFVLTAMTVPFTFLVFSLLGVGIRSRHLVPDWITRILRRKVPNREDMLFSDVLIFGCFLAPLLLIALPNTPKFGGTKHWFPAYPFMAIYFGVGVDYVWNALKEWASVGWRFPRRLAHLVVIPLCLAPSLAETIHSHPMALSHYTMLAGGVSGAADLGMTRQFWGYTTGSVTEFLKQRLPEGGSVWICDTTFGAWAMLQRDGVVPRNIRATSDMAAADYILVHHELHFAEVDFQAWVALKSTQPVHVLTFDGVPIISIYESDKHRSR